MKSNRVPWTVLALASAQVMLSLLYAYATPAFQASDETQHIDMVLEAGRLTQWPEVREHRVSPAVREAKSLTLFERRNSPRPAESAPSRDERASFEDLGEAYSPGAANHINQHPPLYYAAVNAWTTTVTSLSPVDLTAFDRSVLLMRGVGALMSGAVVFLCWRAARIMGLSIGSSLLAASVPMLIPMISFVHGTVNNDSLVILLVAATSVQSLRSLAGDLSDKRAFIIGALAGASMLTKFFGVFTIPIVLSIPFLTQHQYGVHERIRFVCISTSMAFLAGGWWWLRNLIVEGTFQPHGLIPLGDRVDSIPPLSNFFQGMDVRLWQGFIGRFGFINTPIPRWMVVLLTCVILLAMVSGLRELQLLGRRSFSVSAVAMSISPAFLTAPIVVYLSFEYFVTWGSVAGMQGRYLFPGIVGIALLLALGLGRLPRSWGVRWFIPILIVAGNVLGLHSIVRHFWGVEGEDLQASLVAFGRWAPFAPGWSLSLFAVGGLVLVTAMVLLGRSVGVPPDPHTAKGGSAAEYPQPEFPT